MDTEERRKRRCETQKRYYYRNREKRLAKNKRWYEENKERVFELNRKWRKKNQESYNKSQQRYRKKHKEIVDECNNRYNKKYPKRRSARVLLNCAIRNNILEKPSECSKCKKLCKPEGHHKDYDKPLDIVWLCIPCHRRLHFEQINY